ncbi:hypothetical protein CXG81DRAFT_25314 [Caulochytrium protostelioides]|uniref:AAA+ ATPase domain-containing protein n=1 Tax=Caulochytrium protostelioides TaxID=1555241 RepID=A0A4P9XAB0_9FUNG|nr:hypothetical protein CXG81DRAFT_25314 [Caulochytrium protostelioides]|eukprot:RKP02021.1 hypothetical protein CXG81DRAFT_25314 [Caulochytrium protostelioides]
MAASQAASPLDGPPDLDLDLDSDFDAALDQLEFPVENSDPRSTHASDRPSRRDDPGPRNSRGDVAAGGDVLPAARVDPSSVGGTARSCRPPPSKTTTTTKAKTSTATRPSKRRVVDSDSEVSVAGSAFASSRTLALQDLVSDAGAADIDVSLRRRAPASSAMPVMTRSHRPSRRRRDPQRPTAAVPAAPVPPRTKVPLFPLPARARSADAEDPIETIDSESSSPPCSGAGSPPWASAPSYAADADAAKRPSAAARGSPPRRVTAPSMDETDGPETVWSARYAPQQAADAAVHPGKRRAIQAWFDALAPYTQHRRVLPPALRLLVLSGPAGCGKSTLAQLLSREAGYDVVEWCGPSSVSGMATTPLDAALAMPQSMRRETPVLPSIGQQFRQFMIQAARQRSSIPLIRPAVGALPSPVPTQPSQASLAAAQRPKLLMIDELSMLVGSMKNTFVQIMLDFLESSAVINPCIIIMTEVNGAHRETGEAHWDLVMSGTSTYAASDQDWSLASILPRSFFGTGKGPTSHSAGYTHIAMNAVAPSYMAKALKRISSLHFDGARQPMRFAPSPACLDWIVAESQGDLRAAINLLQWMVDSLPATSRSTIPRSHAIVSRGKRQAKPAGGLDYHLAVASAVPAGPKPNPATMPTMLSVAPGDSPVQLFHSLQRILMGVRPHGPGTPLKRDPETILSACQVTAETVLDHLHANWLRYFASASVDKLADTAEALSRSQAMTQRGHAPGGTWPAKQSAGASIPALVAARAIMWYRQDEATPATFGGLVGAYDWTYRASRTEFAAWAQHQRHRMMQPLPSSSSSAAAAAGRSRRARSTLVSPSVQLAITRSARLPEREWMLSIRPLLDRRERVRALDVQARGGALTSEQQVWLAMNRFSGDRQDYLTRDISMVSPSLLDYQLTSPLEDFEDDDDSFGSEAGLHFTLDQLDEADEPLAMQNQAEHDDIEDFEEDDDFVANT